MQPVTGVHKHQADVGVNTVMYKVIICVPWAPELESDHPGCTNDWRVLHRLSQEQEGKGLATF